jgi:hypothetical protein
MTNDQVTALLDIIDIYKARVNNFTAIIETQRKLIATYKETVDMQTKLLNYRQDKIDLMTSQIASMVKHEGGIVTGEHTITLFDPKKEAII